MSKYQRYIVPLNKLFELFVCVFCNKYYLFCLTGPRVLRIETKQVPRPSQAEVVLSDGEFEFSSLCLIGLHFLKAYFLYLL